MPPWREVSHTIPLIDEHKQYKYHAARCPEYLRDQLRAKVELYTRAGWWERASVRQAAPLLCIPKKDNTLRTALDARQRNANTYPDVTPLPDQDQIRHDVARAPYRTKIDLSNAFEQVRVAESDVWKTGFSTILGTFLSWIMQIGDLNAPSTFQRLMIHIFRHEYGVFVHVYLDDIYVYSYSIEDHEKHLQIVFERLQQAEFYLSPGKLDFYSDHLDCLGHIIDHQGLHAEFDKLHRIRTWKTPTNLTEVQRFLGLVNYLAQFLPDVSSYSNILANICAGGRPFQWRPVHDAALERIKTIATRVPILRPVDFKKTTPVWVITDASPYGVGAMYGQGEDWRTCRPAGFLSKKFSDAQRHYYTWEQEALAIIEALMKWEDKLLGYPFTIVTDHKALTFFDRKSNLSPRQARWMNYLQRFKHHIDLFETQTKSLRKNEIGCNELERVVNHIHCPNLVSQLFDAD